MKSPTDMLIKSRFRLAATTVIVLGILLSPACSSQVESQSAPATTEPALTQEPSALNTPDPALLPEFQPVVGKPGLQRQIELHTNMPDRPRLDIIKYLVKEGDTLFGIAEKFGLDPQSVLWGNWDTLEADPHTLRPGQELNIPPVDGVLYPWNEGDSLYSIASFFHSTPEEIVEWPGNHLGFNIDFADPQIEPGTLVVVPDGRRDPPSWQMVVITRANPAAASILGPGYCGSVSSGAIGNGVFSWPTSSHWLSGYHYTPGLHEAIDIGGSIGNLITASDSGVVVYSGWNNYGYGNVVVIDHGTGWQTLYAHLDTISVGCGQSVFQGGAIGTMGVTGNSSGPHLHFEMRSDIWGRVNPLNFLP
ncbi:MAG: peptidoglycan DD-metalloendopeptidase family protein [Anaerolineales bacterium]|jgi:murein DD-endopeptidase MepM/ murein hydrolase activator NlpD